jgi:hypothetical protein
MDLGSLRGPALVVLVLLIIVSLVLPLVWFIGQ